MQESGWCGAARSPSPPRPERADVRGRRRHSSAAGRPLRDAIGALEEGLNPAIRVAPAAIVEVCAYLKSDPALAFDCLSNQSGVDYPKRNEIEVVYHLISYRLRHACV